MDDLPCLRVLSCQIVISIADHLLIFAAPTRGMHSTLILRLRNRGPTRIASRALYRSGYWSSNRITGKRIVSPWWHSYAGPHILGLLPAPLRRSLRMEQKTRYHTLWRALHQPRDPYRFCLSLVLRSSPRSRTVRFQSV
jgi:hypothetical protein